MNTTWNFKERRRILITKGNSAINLCSVFRSVLALYWLCIGSALHEWSGLPSYRNGEASGSDELAGSVLRLVVLCQRGICL